MRDGSIFKIVPNGSRCHRSVVFGGFPEDMGVLFCCGSRCHRRAVLWQIRAVGEMIKMREIRMICFCFVCFMYLALFCGAF